jgi:hypothetical protein
VKRSWSVSIVVGGVIRFAMLDEPARSRKGETRQSAPCK